MSTTHASPTTAVTIGGSSAPVVAKNVGRKEITICNDHATQVAYLAFPQDDSTPTAALNAGIRLNAAGGSWTSNVWDGAVYAIATGAGTVLTVFEC